MIPSFHLSMFQKIVQNHSLFIFMIDLQLVKMQQSYKEAWSYFGKYLVVKCKPCPTHFGSRQNSSSCQLVLKALDMKASQPLRLFCQLQKYRTTKNLSSLARQAEYVPWLTHFHKYKHNIVRLGGLGNEFSSQNI